MSLPGSLSEEILDELWSRAYDICQYEAGNLEVDGHRWCVLAGGDAVDTLAAFRIEAQLRQADWLIVESNESGVRSRPPADVGFVHPLAADPSQLLDRASGWARIVSGGIKPGSVAYRATMSCKAGRRSERHPLAHGKPGLS